MSKLGLVIVMLLMAGRNNAQNYPAPGNEPLTYFVLIQTDDGRAFYVRLNNQLYSSSPAGHLILSQLKDSAYTITVGFPGQTFAEQRFPLNIHGRDWALHLSRQDARWQLYDGQGQALAIVADPSIAEGPALTGMKKEDAFSQLMSAIVQDTAVMYNTYAGASADSVPLPHPGNPASATFNPLTSLPLITAPQTTAPLITASPATASQTTAPPAPASLHTGSASIQNDTTTLHTDSRSLHAVPPSSSTNISARAQAPDSSSRAGVSGLSATDPRVPSAPTGVVKLSERKSTQSLNLIFADHPADKKADTIDVVIPVDSPAVSTPRTKYPDTSHATVTRKPSPDILNSAFPTPGLGPKSDTPTPALANSHKPGLPFVNSDCHAFATDYDVDKLRIRMLEEKTDDDRIQAAYKVFKIKCFSTRQVRALSEVFAADSSRFRFLATAYPFVSDDQFSALIDLFSDPVYTGKFRTMTDHH